MFLYPLFDFQNMALKPLNAAAKLTSEALASPFSPLSISPISKYFFSQLSDFEHSTRSHDKPRFNILSTKFRADAVAVHEQIIETGPFHKLLRFKRTSENPSISQHIEQDPKVLIVTPMAGHFSTLMRGTVEAMLPSHDVYITDWTDAKLVPLSNGFFDLEDQIDLLITMIRRIGPDVHVIGVSQASVAVLAACSLMAQDSDTCQPCTMTLIGGPIDARDRASALSCQAKDHSLSWFRQHQIQMIPAYYPGAFRLVYPGYMQLMDRMSLTMNNQFAERTKYFMHLVSGDDDTPEAHEVLYDDFLSTMDVPEEFYIQFVERAYQRCDFPNGSFSFRGQKVDPAAITKTALLTIEGEQDDLSPPGQTRAALDLCTGLPAHMKQAHMEIGIGHYGIFSGRKWRNNIQPILHKFIRAHAAVGEMGLAENE